MSANTSQNKILSSTTFYKLLLNFYPAEHREDYGPWMMQLFQDMCRDARRDEGHWGIVKVMVRMVFDTTKNAAIEHLDKKGLNLMKDSPTHIGRYKVKDLLGTGGVSNIYLGHDPETNHSVALKVMSGETLSKELYSVDSEEIRQLFFHEAELLKELK